MTKKFYEFQIGIYFFATADYKRFDLPMDEDELNDKIKEINWQDGDYEVQEYNTPFEPSTLRNFTVNQLNELAELMMNADDTDTFLHKMQYMIEEESGLEIWELARKAEDRLMLFETSDDKLSSVGGELFDIFVRGGMMYEDESSIQTLLEYFNYEAYADDFVTNNELRLSNYSDGTRNHTWVFDFRA